MAQVTTADLVGLPTVCTMIIIIWYGTHDSTEENKKIQSSAMNYLNSFQRAKNDALDGPATSPPSLLPPFGGVARNLRPAQSRLRELYPTGDNDATDLTVSPLSTSSQREDIMRPDHAHESPQFQGLMLPPSSPPVNISSSLKSAPQASPSSLLPPLSPLLLPPSFANIQV